MIKHSLFADQEREAKLNVKISTASEHDTLHFEEVIDPANTSRDSYADKGYVDGQREARLKRDGWRMHIQRKGSTICSGFPT